MQIRTADFTALLLYPGRAALCDRKFHDLGLPIILESSHAASFSKFYVLAH